MANVESIVFQQAKRQQFHAICHGQDMILKGTKERTGLPLESAVNYLTFVCACIVGIIVNDDQEDATILSYLFIPNQLYVFRVVFAHQQEHLTVFTASDIEGWN